MTHRPAIDGLRFYAFLAVFFFHADDKLCPWGWGGVPVFFALSGFLITRILIDGETGSIGADLRRYYVRRTLRIFPLYYAMVTIIALQGELTEGWWYVAYLSNVKAYFDGQFNNMLGHFWTLSVEEQFYVAYPPLLLVTRAKARPCLIVGMVAASIVFQFYAFDRLRMPLAKWLLPYCGSHLAWGAFFGWLERNLPDSRNIPAAMVLSGLALLAVGWQMDQGRLGLSAWWEPRLSPSLYGLAGGSLVFGLWRTTHPLITWPFAFWPIAALGRISYGLYAFHIPVLHGQWGTGLPYAFMLRNAIGDKLFALSVTIGLAALSWRYFERPILKAKERWAPRPRQQPIGDL